MQRNRINQAVHRAARNKLPDLPPEIIDSIREKLPFVNGLRMNVAQRKFTNSRFSSTTKFQARLVAGLDLLRSKVPRLACVLIERSSPGSEETVRTEIRYDDNTGRFLTTSDRINWTWGEAADIIEHLLEIIRNMDTTGGSLTIELPVGFVPFKYAWPGFELQGEARAFI